MADDHVVFLPGLLCDRRLWRDQAAAAGPGRAVEIDTDLSLDDNLDAMAARVLARADAAGARRLALAGFSMGGYVAFAILRRAPARVSRLALFDTSARPDSPAQIKRRKIFMALSRRGEFRGVTPRLLPTLLAPARLGDAALGAEIGAMAQRIGRDGFLRQQQAIMGRPDSRPLLAALAIPTLIAVGAADALTPPDRAEEMAALVPGAALARIPDAGHMAPMEQPGAVNALLKAWLAA